MSVKFTLEDGKGTGLTQQVFKRNGNSGAVVYTESLKQYVYQTKVMTSPVHGINMNIDASFSGTPVEVHDGEDNSYWTATTIAGTKFTFNSTDRANTNTQSVKTNNPNINDIMQFSTGAAIGTSGYTALTMFINVDQDWAEGSADSIEIYGWDTVAGMQLGTAVKLEEYFNETDFDTWHKIGIPLSDMSLTNVQLDAFRIEIVAKSGKSPIWYLDDFQIEEFGGAQKYSITADKGTRFHAHHLNFTFADAYDSSVINSNMPGIPYDSFLGVPALATGLDISSLVNGHSCFQGTYNQLSDLLALGEMRNPIFDGTNTYFQVIVKLSDTVPVTLDSRFSDHISMTISDNLSGLLLFRVHVRGTVEKLDP